MEKIVLTLLLTLVSIVGIAQDQKIDPKQSNAEIFSAKSGTLIEKQFRKAGKIGLTELKIIKLTDMISGQSISALRFELEVSGKYSSDTKIASLDIDEIDALIKSIQVINEDVFNFPPENYTEITFRSRSGFKAGCYWSKDQWKPYIQIEKHDRKSLVRLSKGDFLTLLELLKQVKEELK
ncbi:hypothetical protein J8281_06750 [Aquimarina sp. U1-2]|uniref:hypothetical protein n=1 Tax=Aquimarina sp. U1-2 TaxID=2823141 RepID=UPI001AECECBF|nr:hypothetical protein [Aquimarina sp. U1-2]MBP2831883.1 hypothetical protein [Aquimarina sp. U1-2]